VGEGRKALTLIKGELRGEGTMERHLDRGFKEKKTVGKKKGKKKNPRDGRILIKGSGC